MSSKELTTWIAYFHLEPFGYEAQNIVQAKIGSDLINVMSGSKTKVENYMIGVKPLELESHRSESNQKVMQHKLDAILAKVPEE